MYVPHMSDDIEAKVGALPAVDSVAVEVVADEVWTPDRMTDEARAEREEHFRRRIEAHDVTPAYDGEQWADDVTIESTRTEE
jgi:hypothetical protein